MKLLFTKMQGAGNDFIVIDGYTSPIALTPAQIKQLADRHFGVGFDQLLLVEKASQLGVDFKYRIFNADGGEVAQCGNGARCFARYVFDKNLTQKCEIVVETASGVITLMLHTDKQVTVNMGTPVFEPAQIPFIAEKKQKTYALEPNTHAGFRHANSEHAEISHAISIEIAAVSMGNPHAVMLVDDVETAHVAEIGPALESHPRFPERVNVGFMQIVNPHEIKLRVYERGSGETLACGTGACAAAVSGIQLGLLQSPVLVHARGGKLQIAWESETSAVMMTGPAEMVFEGSIEIEG
jgi:diaminopimelate epimerase